jgi:hypothetical protein
MMSVTSLPIPFKPRCDKACDNMHAIAHQGLDQNAKT